MKLIVDTNVVFSALIKDSKTRKLLVHSALELHAPGYLFEELQANKKEITLKAGITSDDFDVLTNALTPVIKTVSGSDYEGHLSEACKLLTDLKDAPFAAAAIAL